jgi:hypothetical protein
VGAAALFPTPLPYSNTRGSSASHTAFQPAEAPPPPARPEPRTLEAAEPRSFSMPPGYVPDNSRGPQFGPIAIAAVGIGAMILSYITFLSFNSFK